KAYFLSDSFRAALDLESRPEGQVILTAPPKVSEPVTVIVAEYDGALSLAASIPPVSEDGGLQLLRTEAREYFHYNGRGYYEKPKLYKLEWRFQVPEDGNYAIEAAVRADKKA